MTLDQHKEQFADAIRLASETLGISPIYVEKDYWITKMLRRLSESNLATHIVWKGGTSLSKGYGVIDRFSSDIDVANHCVTNILFLKQPLISIHAFWAMVENFIGHFVTTLQKFHYLCIS